MIPFDEFEGATAEAGDPNTEQHPFPPPSSRAVGDAFVHFVYYAETEQDIIRFWFPEQPKAGLMPVDYEILQSRIITRNSESIVIDDDVVIKLIIHAFFQQYCGNYYANSTSSFSFRRLGQGVVRQVAYPHQQ